MNAIIEIAIQNLAEIGLPIVEEKLNDALDSAVNQSKKFAESFQAALKSQIHILETDLLSKSDLIDISRKYMVAGCSEVAATKKIKNNIYIVYLAYTKDKVLLPVKQNSYIIIKAKGLSPDVLELFGSDHYIILK